VSHLNLHKTFTIPHGGGGPCVVPVAVRAHLAPFLPGHPLRPEAGPTGRGYPDGGVGPVSGAPWGSAGVLPIPWAYIRLMGAEVLTQATKVAILNANYIASRLKSAYPILYSSKGGRVAHECILDTRVMKDRAWVTVDYIAKLLIDSGFHAPTMSFPVAGTLMIEPTESESKAELDRFVDAMIAIRAEIREIEAGRMDRADNPLKHAPHTAAAVAADDWAHAYPRRLAGWPSVAQEASKYWPPVARVDNVYGDRNLVCTCPPMANYMEAAE